MSKRGCVTLTPAETAERDAIIAECRVIVARYANTHHASRAARLSPEMVRRTIEGVTQSLYGVTKVVAALRRAAPPEAVEPPRQARAQSDAERRESLRKSNEKYRARIRADREAERAAAAKAASAAYVPARVLLADALRAAGHPSCAVWHNGTALYRDPSGDATEPAPGTGTRIVADGNTAVRWQGQWTGHRGLCAIARRIIPDEKIVI
jgi:hypothetical protein